MTRAHVSCTLCGAALCGEPCECREQTATDAARAAAASAPAAGAYVSTPGPTDLTDIVRQDDAAARTRERRAVERDRVQVVLRMSRAQRRKLAADAVASGYRSVNAFVLAVLSLDSKPVRVASVTVKAPRAPALASEER